MSSTRDWQLQIQQKCSEEKNGKNNRWRERERNNSSCTCYVYIHHHNSPSYSPILDLVCEQTTCEGIIFSTFKCQFWIILQTGLCMEAGLFITVGLLVSSIWRIKSPVVHLGCLMRCFNYRFYLWFWIKEQSRYCANKVYKQVIPHDYTLPIYWRLWELFRV